MSRTKTSRQMLSWLLVLMMLLALLPASAFAEEDSMGPDLQETKKPENDEGISGMAEDGPAVQSRDGGDSYYLMNIPYADFYKAVGAAQEGSPDYDAISQATNKAGNYGKAGGAFHSGTTASTADDGTVTAVGGTNGAKIGGVIWPVKVSSGTAMPSQSGAATITATSTKTVATVGRGQTSATYLYGYECLMEAPAYSCYRLETDTEPNHYLTLSNTNGSVTFTSDGQTSNTTTGTTTVTPSYGTNWGDVQLKIEGVSDVEDKLVNAVVITAKDSSNTPTTVKVGLTHLYNVWSATDIAWRTAAVQGLDGKSIESITYYCTVKDESVGKNNTDVPEYQNYVYTYTVSGVTIPTVKSDTLTATFTDANTIQVSGLPNDILNPRAKVYYTSGGRNPVYYYLTPMEADPNDDDIDPVSTSMTGSAGTWSVNITPGSAVSAATGSKTASWGHVFKDTDYTIEISCDNYIITNKPTASYTPAGDAYVLMNIPYAAFYKAAGASEGSTDFDAISSATNKVGNYGKSGGSFHSAQSASANDDGSFTASGGANGAKNEGAIWPVKVTGSTATLAKLKAIDGVKEIVGNSTVTLATVGRGQTSSSKLVSYGALNEAPAYSYYVLDSAPDNYLLMSLDEDGGVKIEAAGGGTSAATKTGASAAPSYGTNWGDVQLKITGVADVEDKLVNAVVITAKDSSGAETNIGLVHLYNVWSASDIAWRAAAIRGLDGKEITNIRYYCSVKDDSVDESNTDAPAYVNYVYDYPVNGLAIPPIYTGTVTAEFISAGEIRLTGLPDGIQNPKVTVYHNAGGRPAVITYLTPLEVDPADQDIDPVSVAVTNGIITISPTLKTVANNKGDSKTYGQPVDGTEYTIELSCDNWIINKITAVYTAQAGGSGDNSSDNGSSNSGDNSGGGGGGSSKPAIKPGADTNKPATPTTAPSGGAAGFNDVAASAWYADSVKYVVDKGLFGGVGNGNFAPDANMTRAMMWTVLARYKGVDTNSGSNWYEAARTWAIAQNISDGTMADGNVTREQFVTMLWRLSGEPAVETSAGFKDNSNISGYAKTAVDWAVAQGILNGYNDGSFRPQGSATRAEVAKMLAVFCTQSAP